MWSWLLQIPAGLIEIYPHMNQRTSGPVNAHLTPGPGIYFNMFLYIYIATEQGKTTPWGQMLMSTESPYHFAHLLQVLKQSLHIRGRQPLGTNVDVNRKPLSLCPFVASFKTISTHFFMFFHMYIAPVRGRQTHGVKILMSTERPYHSDHLLEDLKKSLWILILYIFLNNFIHEYSPGARADKPIGVKILMSTESPYHFDHLLQVLKKSLWSLFSCVYSPRAGADNALGSKFGSQQKGFITLTICCKFKKKNLFQLWFYAYF